MWIYENTLDNSARFVLGESGNRPLICFGVNPSTAKPEKLDRTVSRVQSTAKQRNFEGWIMLNLYPQRATNPADIHKNLNVRLHKRNLQYIEKVFKNNPRAKVWAAWGGLIEKRTFLNQCLKDTIRVAQSYSIKWFHMGKLLAQGHPHHPLYLKKDAEFRKFDIEKYLSSWKRKAGQRPFSSF